MEGGAYLEAAFAWKHLLLRLCIVVLKEADGSRSERLSCPCAALCRSCFHAGMKYESQVCKPGVPV